MGNDLTFQLSKEHVKDLDWIYQKLNELCAKTWETN